jgi:putative endonuclease
MQDNSCLVFVEVKYRKSGHYGQAAEFVDRKKASRLLRTANIWLTQQGLSPHTTEFRFDVVGVQNNGQDINWIKNAITEG